MSTSFASLRLFVATRAEEVPDDVRRFASVDGSVPGATATWDHHVTGELVNLDAMPDRYDVRGLDAVGTTLADTDAVASAVAVLAGGKAALSGDVLDLLLAASHHCDHLGPHPELGARANERGLGVHRWVSGVLTAAASPSAGFAEAVRALATAIEAGRELPSADPEPGERQRAQAMLEGGRVRIVRGVALVDLRGVAPIDPLLIYALHRLPVAVAVEPHEKGGIKYTVGVNPNVPHPADLGAALARLAEAEHSHGPPCQLERPGPGSENWGGRATVFGSPWNYGSRLAPEEVAAIVTDALVLEHSPGGSTL